MKKNLLQMGVLGAIALGLAGYLVWDISSEKKEVARQEVALRLFPFVADQVNEFRIERSDLKLKVTRSEDGWKIVSPIQDEADNDFTDDFVNRLLQEKYIEVAKEGDKIDFKIYGLDEPIGAITLKTQAGAEKTYEVSAKTNFEQNAFLREPNGHKVYIAAGTWLPSANRGALDFRNKKLYRNRLSAINEIKVQNQFGSTDLILKEGKWLLKDKPWQLDQNKVREIVSVLGETPVEDFSLESAPTPADRKKYSLESPKLKLELVTEKSTWKAEFGKPQEKALYVFADAPAYVLKLATSTYQKFDEIESADLRDKKLPFDFAPGDAHSFEWQSQVQSWKLTKQNDKWVLAPPGETKSVTQEKMAALFKALREMSVSRYADEASMKSKTAKKYSQVLQLKDDKGQVVFELAWGDPESRKIGTKMTNVRLAKTNKFPETFWLDEISLDRLGLKQLLETPKAEVPQ